MEQVRDVHAERRACNEKTPMRRAVMAIVEYLLGFLALAVFAAFAFGAGTPDAARLIAAFKLGVALAALELLARAWRKGPANRLVVGANVWLMLGGIAAVSEQWWWLRIYERMGEASLFAILLVVGLVATVATPEGFVAATGPQARVRRASFALLAAVGAALVLAMVYKGNLKCAAVLPVIGLSWLQRGLKIHVQGRPDRAPARSNDTMGEAS